MKSCIVVPFVILGVALAQGPNWQPRGPAGRGGPGGPGGPGMPMQPPNLSALKTYLNLTDQQVQQIRQAGEEARKQAAEKARTILPQIQQKRGALRDLLAKDTDDPLAVGKLMLEIQALRKQVRHSHEAVRSSMLNVLTPDQKTKFKAIQDAAALPEAAREAMRLGLVPGPRGAGEGGMMGPGAGMRRHGRQMMGRGPGMMGPGMGPGAGFRGQGQRFGPGGPRPKPDSETPAAPK